VFSVTIVRVLKIWIICVTSAGIMKSVASDQMGCISVLLLLMYLCSGVIHDFHHIHHAQRQLKINRYL